MWISTVVSGLSYTDEVKTAFMKLFGFISGANNQKVKIDMTAPVLTMVSPGEGPNCVSNFTVSFYFPWKYQNTTFLPQPTDDTLFVQRSNAMTVAVRSFGGFAKDEDITQNVAALGQDLTAHKIVFQEKPYSSAGYDSPFHVFNRHNEVWLTVKQ